VLKRDFQVVRRRSSTSKIALGIAAAEEASDPIGELVGLVLLMIAEDEARRIDSEDDVPFGLWLAAPGAGLAFERIPKLVEAAAQMRFGDLGAGGFLTVKELARRIGVDRARVLEAISPARAQLMPPLLAAAFAVDGMVGPMAAHIFYVHTAKAGREASVFGVHKELGHGAVARVAGLASVGPDTLAPTSAHALTVGTRDDPAIADDERLAGGHLAMGRCGLSLPASLGEHLDQALQIHQAARELALLASRYGSPACAERRIDPRDLVAAGFSSWLLLGHVETGLPPGTDTSATAVTIAPGLDSAMLQTARQRGMHPVAVVADSAMSLDPHRCAIRYDGPGRQLVGPQLVRALCDADQDALGALRELDRTDVQHAMDVALRDQIPFTSNARYFEISKGLALVGGDAPLAVSALVRIDLSRTIVWTTTLDLGDADALAATVSRAELHVRTMESPALGDGVSRFFKDHAVQKHQASTYSKHIAMRIVLMLANLAVVGAARSREIGRGPT
jgi:hypothetical protein